MPRRRLRIDEELVCSIWVPVGSSGDEPTVDLAMLSSSGVAPVTATFPPLCFCSTPRTFSNSNKKNFKQTYQTNKKLDFGVLGSDSLEQSFYTHQFWHTVFALAAFYIQYIYYIFIDPVDNAPRGQSVRRVAHFSRNAESSARQQAYGIGCSPHLFTTLLGVQDLAATGA